MKYNVISTFSGAMGLDNGLERGGLNVRLCVEFEHAMAETIRANRPNLPLIEDDIRNYSGKDLRKKAGLSPREEVFLMCGGPPCQAFSTAGKRKGFDDARGNVFLKYIELIGEVKPKYFLIENVRGLLSASYRAPQTDEEKSFGYPPATPKEEKGTALLYALQKKGVAFLSPIPGTRNKKNIAFTEFGRDFAEKTVGILRMAELDALAELSPEERELYIRLNEKYNCRLIEKLYRIMDEVNQDRKDCD